MRKYVIGTKLFFCKRRRDGENDPFIKYLSCRSQLAGFHIFTVYFVKQIYTYISTYIVFQVYLTVSPRVIDSAIFKTTYPGSVITFGVTFLAYEDSS